MNKKILIILIIVCFIFLGNKVFADDEIEDINELDNNILSTSSTNISTEPETYSRHIICMERSTGMILYEKDAYTKTPMASTTKILTLIITLERCDLAEQVEISSKAAHTGGSTLGITEGSTMTLEALVYGLMLRSGNDCAVAIAEHIGGSVEGFADIMNEKAQELGLKNSHFVTPHGLDNDEHYTTAFDLAVLTNYALKNDKFREIVGTRTTTIMVGDYPRTITTTNELLGNVEGVYGVKTGFTGNSGRCLVTACKRNNFDIIIVVLGADTKNIRGLDTKKIIDYVFSNFEMMDTYELVKSAYDKFNKIKNIKVCKSLDKVELKLSENDNYIYPIEKSKINNLKTSVYCISLVDYNISTNSKLGMITLKCDDKIIYSLDLILNNKINRITWQEYLKIFILDYKNYFK